MNETNNSEVARLLENIRLSYESAYTAMHGPAISATHEFISKKLENIQSSHVQLQTIVGEHEAMKLVAETLDTANEAKQ
ncbi:hypothetical protein KDA_49520 [Dictyobacter alpinus]|uniref:Uncharacterized protein n=1 Tax=Dictyobacter alpinus TaxID=2014873 RepID=A0A402BDI7_9CHLR|nr:hypothetical protein [Dictyobacter alpinus]GCE29468.1 hypothetical protein KDA_49520 [Dictyobacter alpinus]